MRFASEWDEQRMWKDRPRHDEASHAADGFMTFACSDFPETEMLVRSAAGDRYRRRRAKAGAQLVHGGVAEGDILQQCLLGVALRRDGRKVR